MSKVFGYSKHEGKDWFSTDPYSDDEIEKIKDPEGGNETNLPTAIPSPFARIDLVKTAFRNISKSPDLRFYEITDPKTDKVNVIASRENEMLVSHCLDLAEMIFNIDNLRGKIAIIVWDKEEQLAKLKQSDPQHRRYAETLELHIDQDKTAFNFDLMERLYLIEFNGKIIGCTSPVTLFFPTGNDLKHAQIKLTTNRTLFTEPYAPLYERDPEFQRYLYLLFAANPKLGRRMKDFHEYLDKNFKILETKNPALAKELNKLDPGAYDSRYSALNVDSANNQVDVLGAGLRKRKSEDVIAHIATTSDFRIVSTRNPEKNVPLALQNDFTRDWMYAKDKWHKVEVPYSDPVAVGNRSLPGISVPYPYLTVSDFLEPWLIRLVYPVNRDKFFDGNLVVTNPGSKDGGGHATGYLLPLKPTFFEYFDSGDLLDGTSGKPKIRMEQGVANSVKVILSIPVSRRDGEISFERTYYQTSSEQPGQPDETKNRGVIVDHQFGITLFPFLKIGIPEIKAFYRVQLIDRDVIGPNRNSNFELRFFVNGPGPAEAAITARKVRQQKRPLAGETATSQYYVLEHEFDLIQVRNAASNGASGIIIPKWPHYQQGNEEFSFAIDFGTTNTHIEYKVGSGAPKPFDITPEDMQIATLFHPTESSEDFAGSSALAIRELVEDEFVPRHIGLQSDHRFPHRTVISESNTLNINTETYALADFNIPFSYERKAANDKISSNLKWARREKGNRKRVMAYFENIIMLLRNKVLFNRGRLESTRLVWFYPSSMKKVRIDELTQAWEELFKKYFHSSNIVSITESLAPFYYFKGSNRLKGGSYRPVVSIDIGGGTTDTVIYQDNEAVLLTSFKFAANTIFGDGYSDEFGAANSNGLINKYYPRFVKLVEDNKFHDLGKVLASIRDKNKSEDINALFFSIESNPRIKGDKKHFSYHAMLADDENLKILFLYFYTAIIYHIASLMKHSKLPDGREIGLPKHVLFSGTGSKILSIITPQTSRLRELTTTIFETVYQQKFDKDGLMLEAEKEMPKEVTCKGGLMSKPEDLDVNIDKIRKVLTCLEDNGISTLNYDELNEANKAAITSYVAHFNQFFLDLNKSMSFHDYFGITAEALAVFRNFADKNLRGYLEEGIEFNQKMDETANGEKKIEETLFFYPLIGVINNLSEQLATLSDEKK